ncbi:branched-chain amino acid ABC transporter substrate-binding protein [Nocardioides sp. zg-536]|uniref:Branched-chain amino acid ABC transporter substrate-binding protein n=1 Tax=Nocardioides faecalis TaxID=2803858 RepID=A0A939BWF6_9ACTN|nr:branched-chain amino acid ABC transporter substrate-binding protein [Nocardioides faecalis]MBM9460527.1 branched-chain amino acid ABC transporter substrate-binding protein [Nocardioides faecalis]MBS4754410.1 branched-chain amino acid ABC transporter substrate-binding protein [Nocardioides faecalis]QVI57540.1 branched-chain amino acid ABC transporter substrate-binding protein [Nocardioides faecalis]
MLTLGLSMSACGTTDDDGGSSKGGAACDLKLAFFGPETGDAAGLGKPIIQGAQLAVDQYNKDADCKVELEKKDSQGSPDAAPALATDVVGDKSIIGVVGPAFSGESAAAGPIFAEEGVPTISPSATNPALSENGWDTFHRALGNDATQGPAAAKYIKDVVKAKSVFVIDDASEYGAGLAKIVEKDLGDLVVGTDTIQQKQTDFSATVTKVTDAKPDAVFFGGYYAEATILIGQLRNGGFEGTFVVADGVKDPAFLDAGKAAEGSVITCPCIPDTDPAVATFAKDYEKKFGEAPGTYAAEAYDAASIFLAGIKDGVDNREDMLKFVNDYDAKGVTKQLKFDDQGEPADVHVYAYTVKDGAIVPEGEIK